MKDSGASMDKKRQIMIRLAIIVTTGSLYFLYQLQLGAIPLLLLSIFFFMLAFGQLSESKGQNETKKRDRER